MRSPVITASAPPEARRTFTVVRVPDDPIAYGYGLLKGGPSLTEELLKERQEDLEREERDLPPPRQWE